MIGSILLGKIDERLREIKTVGPHIKGGGLNVIFVGDFYQLSPVGDIPLTKSLREIEERYGKKGASEDSRLAHLGREWWDCIEHCIILTENRRVQVQRPLDADTRPGYSYEKHVKDNELFKQALIGICNGHLSREQLYLLRSRTLGTVDTSCVDWENAYFIVKRNSLRTRLNTKLLCEKAKRDNKTLHIFMAKDESLDCKKGEQKSEYDIKTILRQREEADRSRWSSIFTLSHRRLSCSPY
jgi:hypothetical protein